jgi:hypothetical protein
MMLRYLSLCFILCLLIGVISGATDNKTATINANQKEIKPVDNRSHEVVSPSYPLLTNLIAKIYAGVLKCLPSEAYCPYASFQEPHNDSSPFILCGAALQKNNKQHIIFTINHSDYYPSPHIDHDTFIGEWKDFKRITQPK